MKKVLARLEEIEKLQSDLRRIVPRKTTKQVIRRSPIERIGHWSSSETVMDSDTNFETNDTESCGFPTTRSVNDSIGVSVQAEEEVKTGDSYVLNDSTEPTKPTEARSVLSQSVKSSRKKPILRDLYDSDVEDDTASDIFIENIIKMVDVSIQTKKKGKVDFETFDLFDYFRSAEVSKEPSANATVEASEACGSPKNGNKNGNFSVDTTKGIEKFTNVCVQTAATEQKVPAEPFDILNYFHQPGRSEFFFNVRLTSLIRQRPILNISYNTFF